MKLALSLIALTLAVCCSTGLSPAAESPATPAPKAPYLSPVPDYGHWVITFKYEDTAPPAKGGGATPPIEAPAAPAGFPTTIDTIKTGDLRGVVLTFAGGETKEYTCQGDWILSSTPQGPKLSVASASNAPYIFYTPGFVMLTGVKVDPSTFKEVEVRNGTTTFHYKNNDTDVWVDPYTMHPLAVRSQGVEASYQFLTPPPRPFVIPPDQAVLLQKGLDSYKKVRSLR